MELEQIKERKGQGTVVIGNYKVPVDFELRIFEREDGAHAASGELLGLSSIHFHELASSEKPTILTLETNTELEIIPHGGNETEPLRYTVTKNFLHSVSK